MPRPPRGLLVGPNTTNHVTWRSHNLELVLDLPGARAKLLELLAKHKEKYGILMRSYCLMGSHPHVVCTTTKDQKAFSAFWQVVNGSFARWRNRKTGRRGQVVMDRMRSPMIKDGAHELTVMRYGDLNPVRAGLVRSAKDWAWSSHRHYALGEPNPLIDPAPEYLALGRTAPQRRKAYRALFAQPLALPLLERRTDLVLGPFLGPTKWIEAQFARTGLSPPRRLPAFA